MCQYQMLYYHNVNGYMVRCPECNHIQMAYNSMVLTFESGQLQGFSRRVQQAYEDFETVMDKDIKSVILHTPCEGVRLFLSFTEISLLTDMLQTAFTELQTQELLALFETD